MGAFESETDPFADAGTAAAFGAGALAEAAGTSTSIASGLATEAASAGFDATELAELDGGTGVGDEAAALTCKWWARESAKINRAFDGFHAPP